MHFFLLLLIRSSCFFFLHFYIFSYNFFVINPYRIRIPDQLFIWHVSSLSKNRNDKKERTGNEEEWHLSRNPKIWNIFIVIEILELPGRRFFIFYFTFLTFCFFLCFIFYCRMTLQLQKRNSLVTSRLMMKISSHLLMRSTRSQPLRMWIRNCLHRDCSMMTTNCCCNSKFSSKKWMRKWLIIRIKFYWKICQIYHKIFCRTWFRLDNCNFVPMMVSFSKIFINFLQ